MPSFESHIPDKAFEDAIAYARGVLAPRVEREKIWPVLVAATFFAVCAIGFATAAIMAPPAVLTIPAKTSVG